MALENVKWWLWLVDGVKGKPTDQQIADKRRELQADYESERAAFEAYPSAHAAWRASPEVRAAPRRLSAALQDLEARGLLQCDRSAGTYDLHPVVRGYAIAALGGDARANTGQQVADFFSSRPEPNYDAARTLADLADRVQVVQALNLAGKAEVAWGVLVVNLRNSLLRLEAYHDILALLRPLFADGWSSPPMDVANRGVAAAVAGRALAVIGRQIEADFQDDVALQDDMQRGITAELSTSLRNSAEGAWQRGQTERVERILDLSRDVAAALADANQLAYCDAFKVRHLTGRGALAQARALWTDLAPRLPDAAKTDSQLQAQALHDEAWLLFRQDSLTRQALDAALARTAALGQRGYERSLHRLAGEWHQANGRDQAAQDSFARALEMAHEVRLRDTDAEARRGLSLLRLGRREDAEAAAASAERDPRHAALARLYLALGDRDKARHHAEADYKWHWCDGPPYANHWDLQECRDVLQALGVPEPFLPPFDPANIEPIPYEADIRRLLAEHAAKKKPTDV